MMAATRVTYTCVGFHTDTFCIYDLYIIYVYIYLHMHLRMYIDLVINDRSNGGNVYICLRIHIKVFVYKYAYVPRYAYI